MIKIIKILILLSVQILQFNVHCIMQAVIRRGESFSMESIGNAVYSSAAFLNHSCNPNTVKYWEGARMVLVASQPVRRGAEVTDNYGMHFLNTAAQLRGRWLREHYWCGAAIYHYLESKYLLMEALFRIASVACQVRVRL